MKRNGEVISYTNKEDTLWTSRGDIRVINGGGYDLVVTSELNGFHYEDTCFDIIARHLPPRHVAIGPHLTDIIFYQDTPENWRFEVRPDAMIFNRIDGHWELSMLAEIKSAYANGIERKLHGFSALLSHMRREPWFVPKRLREYAGGTFRVPSISIPQDSQVSVLIASPFPRGTGDGVRSSPFPVIYARVK